MKNLLAMVDLEKENICPSSSPPPAAAIASRAFIVPRTLRAEGRSPLPLGFPRAPLQDITHILSPLGPLNILADDDNDSPSCTARPKRSKRCSASKLCSTRTLKSMALTQCTSMRTIIKLSEPPLSETVEDAIEETEEFAQTEIFTTEEKSIEMGMKEEELKIFPNMEQTEVRSDKKVSERTKESRRDEKDLSVENTTSSTCASFSVTGEVSIEAPQKRVRRSNGPLSVKQNFSFSTGYRKSDDKTRSSVLKFR